jgi:hypothetical protein
MTPKWGGHCNDIVRRRYTHRTWTGTQVNVGGRWRMFRNYSLTINVRNLPSETNEVVYSSDRSNYGMTVDTVPHPAGPFTLSQITENYYCILPTMRTVLGDYPDLSQVGDWVWTNGLDNEGRPNNYAIFVSFTPAASCSFTQEFREIKVMRRSDQVLLNMRCNVTQTVYNEFTYSEFIALINADHSATDMPSPINVGTPVPINTVQDVATQATEIELYNPSDSISGRLENVAELYVSSGAPTPFGRTRSSVAVLPGMHSYKVWQSITPTVLRTGSPVSCSNFRVPCAGAYDLTPPTISESDFMVSGALRRVKDVHFDTLCPP